jgi:glucosylceramidase
VLGHVTRFIRPGAVRVDSTVAGNAWNVAFRNPDGTIVVVVVNDDWGTTAQRFNVRAGSQAFSYELPAGAVATFVLA